MSEGERDRLLFIAKEAPQHGLRHRTLLENGSYAIIELRER